MTITPVPLMVDRIFFLLFVWRAVDSGDSGRPRFGHFMFFLPMARHFRATLDPPWGINVIAAKKVYVEMGKGKFNWMLMDPYKYTFVINVTSKPFKKYDRLNFEFQNN